MAEVETGSDSPRSGAHRERRGSATPAGSVAFIVILALVAVVMIVGVFNIIRLSTMDPENSVAEPPAETSSAPADATPSATPAEVEKTATVVVLNGTGTRGLAAQFAETLQSDGWQVAETGNYSTAESKSTVFYSKEEFKAQAEALAETIGAPGTELSQEFPTDITVVICSDLADSQPTPTG